LSSLNDLDKDARLLTEYADRLDALLGDDWIIARLPGPCHFRLGVSSSALPVEDAEGPEHGVVSPASFMGPLGANNIGPPSGLTRPV